MNKPVVNKLTYTNYICLLLTCDLDAILTFYGILMMLHIFIFRLAHKSLLWFFFETMNEYIL